MSDSLEYDLFREGKKIQRCVYNLYTTMGDLLNASGWIPMAIDGNTTINSAPTTITTTTSSSSNSTAALFRKTYLQWLEKKGEPLVIEMGIVSTCSNCDIPLALTIRGLDSHNLSSKYSHTSTTHFVISDGTLVPSFFKVYECSHPEDIKELDWPPTLLLRPNLIESQIKTESDILDNLPSQCGLSKPVSVCVIMSLQATPLDNYPNP